MPTTGTLTVFLSNTLCSAVVVEEGTEPEILVPSYAS